MYIATLRDDKVVKMFIVIHPRLRRPVVFLDEFLVEILQPLAERGDFVLRSSATRCKAFDYFANVVEALDFLAGQFANPCALLVEDF